MKYSSKRYLAEDDPTRPMLPANWPEHWTIPCHAVGDQNQKCWMVSLLMPDEDGINVYPEHLRRVDAYIYITGDDFFIWKTAFNRTQIIPGIIFDHLRELERWSAQPEESADVTPHLHNPER